MPPNLNTYMLPRLNLAKRRISRSDRVCGDVVTRPACVPSGRRVGGPDGIRWYYVIVEVGRHIRLRQPAKTPSPEGRRTVAQPAGSRTVNPQALLEYTEGTVYVVHLDPPYRRARHYVGHADPGCLQHRLAEHHTSSGPLLLRVQKAAGGSWHLVATFPGTRSTERQLKDGQAVPSYCPDCTPSCGS